MTDDQFDDDGRSKSGLALFVLCVAYVGWFAVSTALGPVWFALLRRGRELADGAWASGDDL